MQITFYANNSEYNRINKVLTSAETLEGTLRESSNVVNPSITVQAGSGIVTYNYCYIPDFKRYYFIDEITSVRNGLWNVKLHSDPLMSFKTAILNSTGVLSNSTSEDDNYLIGSQYVVNCKNSTDIINFSGGFNDNGEYILITAGG